MWPVTDVAAISAVAGADGPQAVFIADGHHRYETACNYRDELAAAGGTLPPQHPANFVLMMCIGMSDPGLLVLPTHRLFRGLPPMTSDELIAEAGRCVSRLSSAGEGSRPGARRLGRDRDGRRAGHARAVTPARTSAGRWPRSRRPAASEMAELAAEHSADWQGWV